ncbi:hypothetical protein LEN26_007753 [Aphanomyces euteiches]|nr:hypothetical protein LEN26_007753 [Aphanomyces euteiches]
MLVVDRLDTMCTRENAASHQEAIATSAPQAAQTQLTDFHSIANLKSPDVTMHWSLEKSTTDGLHIYTGHGFAAPSGTVSLMAVTQLFASLDEVQDMFHTTDDDDYKAFCATFAPGIVDYASLYTLARAHLGHYVGIKWHALQRLTPLSKPRDACTLECHRRFSFAAGGRGWAYTMRSIDLPDVCPDMQNVLDVIRMQVSMLGCTFREIADRPGWLQVTVLVQANPRGSFPQWAFKQAVKRRLLSIAQWDGRFRHRRLAKHAQLLPRAALVPATARRVCYLCRQRFSAFRSKCNCRVCGQVVCRTCQHTWRLHDIDVSVCAACSHNPLAQTPASPEAPPSRISTFHESMLPTGDMGAFFGWSSRLIRQCLLATSSAVYLVVAVSKVNTALIFSHEWRVVASEIFSQLDSNVSVAPCKLTIQSNLRARRRNPPRTRPVERRFQTPRGFKSAVKVNGIGEGF